jgi:hypothetical protein
LYLVLISVITLFWQLFVLFACCSGVGLALRFLLPKEFSLLNKILFSLMGGLFLVVLVPQNLIYLGVPVRISAWLVLGAALVRLWLFRHQLPARIRTLCANGEIRALGAVILLTITLHGIVPIRQGLEWYYGRGHGDHIHYVLLAEFLKEEPYSTGEPDIGLRPWLVAPVGYHLSADQLEMNSGPGVEIAGSKEQRLGQSIITAEMSVWSGTDAKAGYAATVIFFLTLLAICLYVLLRESGVDRLMAGSGALLAALLPVVTRLSLDGFLSQMSILFVFPFFASLLRPEELSARSFTLFFSLTLAYMVSAYSEIAPIGLGTLFLGVMFIRGDSFRSKRLMLMSAILLIALVNPYYLRNLIVYLGQQFYNAASLRTLDNMAPHLLTLRGWSELIFGAIANEPLALFFDYCALLLGVLLLAGAIFLSKRDKPIFGVILLPCILVILYFATRTPPPSYPIGKIVLTILPLVIGLVLIALSRAAAINQHRPAGVLIKLVTVTIVTTAAAGSVRYYCEVLNNEALLRYLREPRFSRVCRELEKIKNKRVFVFENDPLLNAWLCYHARANDVYFDSRFMGDSVILPLAPFSKTPDLANVDFVATRDRLVDLRAPKVACLTLVDEMFRDWSDSSPRYWLGPPAHFRILAMRPISANLQMRLGPGPEATTRTINYFLTDEQGHVSQGEIRGEAMYVRRISIPRGSSSLEISVKAKESDPEPTHSFPILAVLDEVQLSDIDLNPSG